MKTIVLDTNFLLHCIGFRIDFIREIDRLMQESYKLCVLDKTIDELEGKKHGKLAAGIVEKTGIKLIKSPAGLTVDNALLDLSPQETLVGTQDKALKERLKKRGTGVITIRQRRYLIMV